MKRLFGAWLVGLPATVFVFAAALLGAACGLPGRPPLAVALPDARRSPVGCWQLHGVGWEDPFLPGQLRVRFDPARASASDSSGRVLQVERADTVPPRRFQLAWWAPYERADSVYAILGDGFTGLQLRLGLSGDSIAGTAYRFADTPHLRSSGKLRGTRQACRSEIACAGGQLASTLSNRPNPGLHP